MARLNHYTHHGLDRRGLWRRDPDWLAKLPDNAVLLPVWRTRNLVAGDESSPVPVTVPAHAAWWRDRAQDIVLLGEAGGATYIAVDMSPVEAPEQDRELAPLGRFIDLRQVGPLLAHDDGALLAYARGLVWWHGRHRFCGVCGHATESREAGHVRLCTNAACATQHFPRTDPAVIMLVHDGDRCLLGRQAVWPSGMHSVLAGFVEPGESLEGTVAREVYEEVGVEVADVTYHSSQPWPFPQSLMVGFTARATTRKIVVDPTELEAAAWYSREELRRVPPDARPGEAAFCLPRRDSIARRLVEDWLAAA